MYDVLINAAKLAFSEDARKSVSAIVELIQRAPEWQQDICLLEARVERTHKEHAALLAGITEAKLCNLSYTDECVGAFRTGFLELTENAFHYGCEPNSAIGIAIEVSTVYVSVSIKNAKGHVFSFQEEVQKRREYLDANPRSARGRGLLLVADLADTIEGVHRHGVKAVSIASV